MSIINIRFNGLIKNMSLQVATGPRILSALARAGWKEGVKTHFVKELRRDGPSRGIHTLSDLERAIGRGRSTVGRDGTMLHWICNDSAYIAYNPTSKTLVTFSQGTPRR